jgi:hypothetical protein
MVPTLGESVRGAEGFEVERGIDPFACRAPQRFRLIYWEFRKHFRGLPTVECLGVCFLDQVHVHCKPDQEHHWAIQVDHYVLGAMRS